jgi:flotillin
MEADKGLYEILQKDTEVVAAAGGDPTKAFQLLLIENYQNWLKHK